MRKAGILLLLLLNSLGIIVIILFFNIQNNKNIVLNNPLVETIISSPTPKPISYKTPGVFYEIPKRTHVFQSFNNCGPASLSMLLSYSQINKTQNEIGLNLRPYQVPNGDNDDKSVTLEELAVEAENEGLLSYHRPNGSVELLKTFVANDIPIVVRTLLNTNDDIGHYRLVRGFDEQLQVVIQDDSLQGADVKISYLEFEKMWEVFSFEFLVAIPKEKKNIVEAILGENLDKNNAWMQALLKNKELLSKDPENIYYKFNISVSLSNLGRHQKAIKEFEEVESRLSFRTLWYQIEPIESYYALGNYKRVFEITDKIINNQNRAFTELYILRGNIYKQQGNVQMANSEFEKAIFYNKNNLVAKETLENI